MILGAVAEEDIVAVETGIDLVQDLDAVKACIIGDPFIGASEGVDRQQYEEEADALSGRPVDTSHLIAVDLPDRDL